ARQTTSLERGRRQQLFGGITKSRGRAMAASPAWRECVYMKTKRILSVIGLALLALSPAMLAAGHGGGGGGGGGFGSTFSGGGHFGGGGGASHSGARGASGGRPGYFYSRGMGFARSRTGQVRSPIQQSHASTRTNRG